MEVILNNAEVLNAFISMHNILQLKGLPIKTFWNISKNIKKIEKIYTTYIECENKLVKQYALKDEQGNICLHNENSINGLKGDPEFAPTMKAEYLIKRNELLACENNLDILTIKLSELDGRDDIVGADLYNIMFMIDDDDNE
jgi:hypothetical protein